VSEKIEQFWRDATPDDVVRVMNGEKVEARFRDRKEDDWNENRYLGGFDATSVSLHFWISEKAGQWKLCQVYDPPEWYINKPDPGKGFRLLEKFPPEPKLATDDAWDVENRDWRVTSIDYGIQCEDVWYRRRIETNNPVIQDSCRSRDTIPSGWLAIGKDEERLASDAYWSQGAKDWIIIGDDRVAYANELPKWHAIRRMEDFVLVEGFTYTLPTGKVIRITAKGFEVL